MEKSNEYISNIWENENGLKSDGRLHIHSCKAPVENQSDKFIKDFAVQVISPEAFSTSSESCVSSSSGFSVEVNSSERVNQQEGITLCGQEGLTSRDGQLPCPELTLPNKLEGSDTITESNLKKVYSEGNGVLRTNGPSDGDPVPHTLYDTKSTSEIWDPPEAEDSEDDMEGSVANEDDDDEECGDGTQWGKPSSLSSFRRDISGSFKYEEKQKAIEKTKNEKFKPLVVQLLKYFGIDILEGDGKKWVDIVTSLSWEAASFVKPDFVESKATDPDSYLKVKCIATGSRIESEVVKGLVFKKNACHKHMPTKYKNPRLLLIRGMLGESLSSLSSFNSMTQETNYLKSIAEMIDTFHPNVILVEKSVSRDVQECILKKGVTLVFDMKLHRLERIARCTDSPIISFDTLNHPKLKHCEYFRIEKFVEELAVVGEGGKKPSKTLMFLEGCPTHLGCTILLKGAHSDELKRIKHVLKYSVVMAYHLILETCFLMDQKTMVLTVPSCGESNINAGSSQSKEIVSDDVDSCSEEPSADSTFSQPAFDIPISEVIHEEESQQSNFRSEWNGLISFDSYNPAILSALSSLSAVFKNIIEDKLPHASTTSYLSLSSNLDLSSLNSDNLTKTDAQSLPSAESDTGDAEAKGSSDEEKSVDMKPSRSAYDPGEVPRESSKGSQSNEDSTQSKDEISTLLESQSILVLMSRRNVSRGSVCEERRFSHIKFYKDFDVPLGRFLRENILNQKRACSSCGELPEAHVYYYAHRNKQLTIHVKWLHGGKRLPGETEGKLWMWSRCGKCKPVDGISKSTKRVLISAAGRGLSFGKFLELSFSQYSSSTMLSSCGHSVYKDFLHFFGLGPMVAMFSYALVVTYSISLPPQMLDFNCSISEKRLSEETRTVYRKGMSLFEEVDKCLQKIGSKFEGSSLELSDSVRKFSDIDELLRQEKSEFEVNFKNCICNEKPHQGVYKLLKLNRLLWELVFESCIWEHRLHSLLSVDPMITKNAPPAKAEPVLDDEVASAGFNLANNMLDSEKALDDTGVKVKVERLVEGNGSVMKEDIVDQSLPLFASVTTQGTVRSVGSNTDRSYGSELRPDVSIHLHPGKLSMVDQLHIDRTIPIASENDGSSSVINLHVSQKCGIPESGTILSSHGWIWTSFSKLRQEYMKDIQGCYLPGFESVYSRTADCLPSTYQLILEEGSKLRISLDPEYHIVSDYEGELSSIIACALAVLKDLPVPMENFYDDVRIDKVVAPRSSSSTPNLSRIASLTSPLWSPSGSFSSDGALSASVSLDESIFDLLDPLVSFGALHPEISLGFTKSLGKGKYSVVCLYAAHFRDLRNRCCPSEQDYIASLSRCRNWDAKGGKSKALFAKTLDDRFIIKEIKKTEFESFMKFAPDYFNYMTQSFELGNQTCLAKILGIYQVTIRQSKSGKEIKHDLLVMENLTFGRKISKQYDLKGALHARLNNAADASEDVLLDQNFVNDMNASPLYVSNTAKRHLQRAVWNDTTFLNSINVMDYSLLVGVDAERRELVCGIIDYLRQYTWDKQLETWVKSSLVVPKNLLPTVISPKEYKKRFRKFMSAHFSSVPDHWCSHSSSCELCEA